MRRSIAILSSLFCLLCLVASEGAAAAFKQEPFDVSHQKLFELGVSDFNADGNLDIFSTNHKYRGTLLAGNGRGGFVGALDSSGLSATADTPGVDDLFSKPQIAAKGLYIWIDKKDLLHVRTVGLGTIPQIPQQTVSGSISYPARDVFVRRSRGAEISITGNEGDTGKLSFKAGSNSEIVVFARLMDLPIHFDIEGSFPRQRILLGPRLSHPPAHEFTIKLGDRHGVAWGDFNSDGVTDAYIANGGQHGRIPRVGGVAEDQLYFGNGDGSFIDRIKETQITKGFCRGRYAAPVDYDADGDLDVFVGCEDRSPILFMQRIPGRFGSRSHLLTAVRARADLYRWVDLERDARPELIAIFRRKIAIYGQKGEGYVRRSQIRSGSQGKVVDGLSVGDFDRDADPDLFVASRGGNTLLRNTGRRFKPQKPGRLGLPVKGSVSANWVDFDNDGLLDLHTFPQGLFRQVEPGRFRSTGQLDTGKRSLWAAANFADVDSDGDRDLIAALKQQGKAEVRTMRFDNQTAGGNWLQLDLRGKGGNPQAVGARVTVTASGTKQTAWVGQSEGSRYSSGHYRLYFGLGGAEGVSEVSVRWPDGTSSEFGPMAAGGRYALIQGQPVPYAE